MRIDRDVIRWGILGCGDVTEIKSGPGFQKAAGSALVAVMRRDLRKAQDYAARHGVPRAYSRADDLIADPDVDAVYVATPPDSHCELALKVADAGKPCLVEKPMALDHAECVRMNGAFARAGRPLWIAYYRRALPRFLLVRELLQQNAIGPLSSVRVEVRERLAPPERTAGWRFDPRAAGGGLFFDLGSHSLDLVDFLAAPIAQVWGGAANTAGAYRAEDVTVAAFLLTTSIPGTGEWNFNADRPHEALTFTGPDGTLTTPIFADADVVLSRGGREERYPIRNPPHVHQPLIQTIVDELLGRGRCESTGESGARTARVMDQCVAGYYADRIGRASIT